MFPTEDLLSAPAAVAARTRRLGVPKGTGSHVQQTTSAQADLLADMEQWHLACRIAASKRLSKSDRLPKFLLYICEQALTGNAGSITEQRIGTHIFNRPTDYNPGEDNIVRSYARMLRKRLDEYFDAEGSQEPLRITIPRGGYVPIFAAHTGLHLAPKPAPNAGSNPMPLPDDASAAFAQSSGRPVSFFAEPRQRLWLTGLICLLLGSGLGAFGWSAFHPQDAAANQELAHPLWQELFQGNRSTFIVPPDSGLGILQNLTGNLIPLENYANGSYFSGEQAPPRIDAGNLADLRQQRYTSVVALDITASLMHLHELSDGRSHVHYDIRYARSITAEDLKSSNAILLGSSHTNPWVSLFEDRMNFRLQFSPTVDQSLILNERPVANEQKQYRNGTGTNPNRTYGVIDYLPNLDGSGHVLIIQGLNMAATEAAADILFHSPEIRPILLRAQQPNGSLRSFELLIQTNTIGATDHDAQIIATRFYD